MAFVCVTTKKYLFTRRHYSTILIPNLLQDIGVYFLFRLIEMECKMTKLFWLIENEREQVSCSQVSALVVV